MKKTQNVIIVAHEDQSENDTPSSDSTNVSVEVRKALDQSPKEATSPNATTKAILKLKSNPFFNDKRKWDDSFTIAEKKDLEGNIVKAAKDNDGETYVTLKEEEFVLPQLSLTEEDSQESDDLDSTISKKPGRKPMPDEDDLSDPDQDPKVKRKAQNRAAQRAFRERKERYVKELEIKIKQVQDSHLIASTQLVRENQQLRAIVHKLEMENASLKGVPYQPFHSELNSVPHYQPHIQQQRQQSIYPHIAPSIQPMILPPSSPIYPISPVLSAAFQTAANTISSPPKAVPKKVIVKPKMTPPPQPPLEYTFSISTPASLRPAQQQTSPKQTNKSEPIELVQLYPPGSKPFPKAAAASSPSSIDSPSITDETSSVGTVSTQGKKMHQLELDFSDCHIDTEGRKFCNQLRSQVCNDAFDRLLSEPLFDQMGKLNLSIGPVPILTCPVEEDIQSVKSHDDTSSDERLLSCHEIWFVLNRHKEFNKFTTDQLCQAVKELAKCSDSGPVLGESDVLKILTKMDQGYL